MALFDVVNALGHTRFEVFGPDYLDSIAFPSQLRVQCVAMFPGIPVTVIH